MTIKHLYPNSRPTLDLKFAKDKTLDPRITFTRASSGTYVDEDGVIQSAATNAARFDHDPVTNESLGLLVEEARTNLQTYSQDFTDASWLKLATVVPNAGLAPDGTLKASLVYPYNSGSSTYIYRSGTSTSAIRTNTIYAKASGKSWMYLFDPGNTAPVYFNLADGTLGTVASGVSATISSMGNGWYRCSATTNTANVYTNFFFAPCNANNDRYASASGTDGILVWGAQQETGSFPTSYIPTPATFTSRASTATYYDANGVIQTAASGVARSNAYFPDENGVMQPAGLLLEGSGTNYITNSGQLETKSGQNIAIASSGELAPDQTSTAALLTEDTSNGFHLLDLIGTTTFTPNATLSSTIYAKNESVRYIGLSISDGFVNIYDKVFDLQNGAILTGTYSTPVSASIKALPNGWYKCSITATVTGYSTANAGIYLARTQGWNYLGDGSSGAYIWGAQLEASPYPTSYIPTAGSQVTRAADVSTSSTVTRAADVASITGSNFSSWYNQSEGTLLTTADYNGTNSSGYNMIVEGYSGASFRDFSCDINASYPNFVTRYSFTSLDLVPVGGPIPTKTAFKLVGSYSASGSAAVFNGGAVRTTGAATAVLTPADAMSIGYRVGSTLFLNGHISRLTYYPTRLSNAILQSLTT